MPCALRCFATALLGTYAACLGIWAWLYGWDNTFMYTTGLWFASHLLLAELLNIMFSLLRLYRIALQNKEKKE